MTAKGHDRLIEHYRSLQARWSVADRSADYAPLVVSKGNASEPIHGWFHFKEGFSSHLLSRLFKDAAYVPTNKISILDPFLGSGTTLVSAILMARDLGCDVTAVGVERNPIIYEVAKAKVASALRGSSLLGAIASVEGIFWKEFERLKSAPESLTTPSTTLNNSNYFAASYVRSLLSLNRATRVISEPEVRAVFRACVSAAVEPSAKLRRDGRALRYVPDRETIEPIGSFRRSLAQVSEDLKGLSPMDDARIEIVHGDARDLDLLGRTERFEWIVFSPPYPNNIDYTEVYKIEAWALEEYSNAAEMKKQRLKTLRSHPSIRFPDEYHYKNNDHADEIDALLCPLLESVPSGRYERGRRQLILGYVDDMLRVLRSSRKLVARDGVCAIVVGNSVHGSGEDSFVIAADLLLARAAEFAGWSVEEIRVARHLSRRGAGVAYLRESIIVLRAD
ncbi:SAM-dependent methyltransferase [Actinomadura viridis]|uniref:SAM-dependent methyltransferase n=1 Tax=Actinomadura viridis TaxID=58110 RepID=A0A931DGK8_9ACTN|nr:SAM-dependent methyltransferase [Actinomadura viridis]